MLLSVSNRSSSPPRRRSSTSARPAVFGRRRGWSAGRKDLPNQYADHGSSTLTSPLLLPGTEMMETMPFPHGFSPLFQLRLFKSCSHNIDDALERFFTTHNQHYQCAVAETSSSRTGEIRPLRGGKIPALRLICPSVGLGRSTQRKGPNGVQYCRPDQDMDHSSR